MSKEPWSGIYKLMEEMGELQQILAKLCVFPDGNHPGYEDKHSLFKHLEQEVGDVQASLDYFINTNVLDQTALNKRYIEKMELYHKWVLSGVKKG